MIIRHNSLTLQCRHCHVLSAIPRLSSLHSHCSHSLSVVEDTKPGWFDSVVYAVLNRYYQLVEDFSVTSEDIEEPEVSVFYLCVCLV